LVVAFHPDSMRLKTVTPADVKTFNRARAQQHLAASDVVVRTTSFHHSQPATSSPGFDIRPQHHEQRNRYILSIRLANAQQKAVGAFF
jgi:hypothetical protein